MNKNSIYPKNIPLLAVLLIYMLLNEGCKKAGVCDCFKGTGEISTEERQLPTFTSVYVEDNVNLIFVEDTVQKVIVEAGKNLLKNIKTEMIGDQLQIRNINKCNFVRKYDIPINVN